MKTKSILSVILFSVLFFGSGQSQNLPDPMTPPRLVNDFAGFLSSGEVNSLEQKLLSFNNQTSTQIYVVTVADLEGYDPSDYTTRLAEKWGVGQKGKDNGIMIMIKPKTSSSKGEVFIAVGYGLEGVVPDAVANRIVNQEVIPAFKNGDNFGGIDLAVDRLIGLTKGEYTADQYLEQTASKPGAAIGSIIFFIIMMIIVAGGRSRGSRHSSIGRSLPFWLLMGMMGSGRSSGSFGDFRSGSGGFGGFGGFGGGGGGSFGGGGAGGSW